VKSTLRNIHNTAERIKASCTSSTPLSAYNVKNKAKDKGNNGTFNFDTESNKKVM
jgi:hypothetical protein